MTAHRAVVVGLGGLGSATLHRLAAELAAAAHKAWDEAEAEADDPLP